VLYTFFPDVGTIEREVKYRWTFNKKAELSQRWPRDARYVWVPWKFSGVPDYTPTATFPDIFNGLLFRLSLWMCVQNLNLIALHVPEIIRGTQKIWTVPRYAHAPFSPKFLTGFCSDGPFECTCTAKFEVHRFTRCWVEFWARLLGLIANFQSRKGWSVWGMLPFVRA